MNVPDQTHAEDTAGHQANKIGQKRPAFGALLPVTDATRRSSQLTSTSVSRSLEFSLICTSCRKSGTNDWELDCEVYVDDTRRAEFTDREWQRITQCRSQALQPLAEKLLEDVRILSEGGLLTPILHPGPSTGRDDVIQAIEDIWSLERSAWCARVTKDTENLCTVAEKVRIVLEVEELSDETQPAQADSG